MVHKRGNSDGRPQVSARLPRPVYRTITQVAKQTGTSVAAIIRDMVVLRFTPGTDTITSHAVTLAALPKAKPRMRDSGLSAGVAELMAIDARRDADPASAFSD